MDKNKITNFIQEARKSGTSDAEITSFLKGKGVNLATGEGIDSRSQYDRAMGIGDTSKPILSQAKDQAVAGFKQIQEGAQDPNILSGLQKIGRGALNEGGAALRAVFSPVEAATKIVSKIPVVAGAENATNEHLIKPIADALSNNKHLQDFMQSNPNADEILGNILQVGGTLVGGAKAPEIKAAVNNAAETVAPIVSSATKKVADVVAPVTSIPSKIVSRVIPQTVEENVSRVLTNTGKKNLAGAANNTAIKDAAQAFDIIHQNAPNITVKDINGVDKAFEPTKTNFIELPQALQQTKKAVYDAYTKVATDAGDAGVNFGQKDFVDLKASLAKYDGKGYTPAFSAKAKQLSEALDRYGTVNPKDGQVYFKNTSPNEIQDLIQQINTDVNPLSDKAGSQVATDFSQALRGKLDAKLEASGNPNYQELRTQYSKLKSVENDVITRYKKALRESGAKPDLVDHITSMDALYGLLSGNIAHLGAGLTIKGLRATLNKVFGPEASLQRTFKLLGKDSEAVAK